MSSKGNKLYRLWLPVLPAMCVVCAWGWGWLAGRSLLRLGPALLLLFLVLPWTRVVQAKHPFERYGAYWKAIAFVNEEVRSLGQGEALHKPVLACAYQWAIYMRASPRLENDVFPFVLDTWPVRSEEEKALQVELLDHLDWLLLHEPVLRMHPELMHEVNQRMEVRAAFFDPEEQGELGPVFVLGRRSGLGHTFFDVSENPFATTFSIAGEPSPLRFSRDYSGRAEEITLLDVEYKTLPGDGFGWLTWHWRADSSLRYDHHVLGRITGPGGVHLWHNPHDPGYGVLPTSTWEKGWVVRESYIVAPRTEARAQLQQTGQRYDEDELDASVWVALVRRGEGRRARGLDVFRFGEDRPVRETLEKNRLRTEDGFVFSKDGMVRVGELRIALDPSQ